MSSVLHAFLHLIETPSRALGRFLDDADDVWAEDPLCSDEAFRP